MITVTCKNDFDIAKIAESGQCFRMNYTGDGKYEIISKNKYVEVRQNGESMDLSCDMLGFDRFWYDYFDWYTNYDYMTMSVPIHEDDFLRCAINAAKGIHILKQDFFEMLITCIISQRKDADHVKECVKELCNRYGNNITGINMDGKTVTKKAFPDPQILASISISELKECGLGYRDEYVHNAAVWFVDTFIKVPSSKEPYYNSYCFAKNKLKEINGVGDKVANGICLFALHHFEACSLDTHLRNIIDREYKGVVPVWMASCNAGVFQHYCAYYDKYKR